MAIELIWRSKSGIQPFMPTVPAAGPWISPDVSREKKLYLIGSLRNQAVADTANKIEDLTKNEWKVFDEWLSAGPEADDEWRDHQTRRGRSYKDALSGAAARNVFNFDKKHLDDSDAVVLLAPAGKSGHLELGYAIGRGKPGYYLLDDPERWDVMLQFCTGVFLKVEDLVEELKKYGT